MSDQQISPSSDIAASSKTFRFLELPAEIRNAVYRELLVLKNGELEPQQAKRPASLTHTISTSILRTSKQIHNEALAIFYSANSFYYHLSSGPNTAQDYWYRTFEYLNGFFRPNGPTTAYLGKIHDMSLSTWNKNRMRELSTLLDRLESVRECQLVSFHITIFDPQDVDAMQAGEILGRLERFWGLEKVRLSVARSACELGLDVYDKRDQEKMLKVLPYGALPAELEGRRGWELWFDETPYLNAMFQMWAFEKKRDGQRVAEGMDEEDSKAE